MSSLNYETVARFAQQGGTVYFAFQDLARLPLEDDEDDHVGA